MEESMSNWSEISKEEKIQEEYLAREKAIFDEAAKVPEREERKRKEIDEAVKEAVEKAVFKARKEVKIEAALALIAYGDNDEKISRITKLTIDEVQVLRQNKK